MTAKNGSIRNTFIIHDYETFGQHPALDRPAQFAAIRTDSDFNIIETPQVLYCRPANDYLPQPEAVMITGITPQLALEKGVNEAEFAQQIHQQFCVPGSCIMGYNNIRFDDEVSRHLFYRNFYDPYGYSWQHGNSRWDLLDVLRACYALRPEGIHWPKNDEGLPSFKLEHLSLANNIEHHNAHDAMADVYATLEMAKRVKQAQPRLFNYLFQLRHKNNVAAQIDIPQMKVLVHVSGMFGMLRSNTSLVAPLAWHPLQKNTVITCDLAGDISPLLHLDAKQLREHLYTKRSELPDDALPIPLKLIHINKCPVLAPEQTLRPEDAKRVGIDKARCMENWQQLRQQPTLRDKVVAIFSGSSPPTTENVDAQLYQGFFNRADHAAMEIIRETLPQNLAILDLKFNDPRIPELLFRYRARNFPQTLNKNEQQRWQQYRKTILTPESLQYYLQQLEMLYYHHEKHPEKLAQLKALFDYAHQLARTVD